MKIIERSFYQRPTAEVASNLIGHYLVRDLGDKGLLIGKIVETEAYGHTDDPASHSYKGKTERNRAMFEEVAHAYIAYGIPSPEVRATCRIGISKGTALQWRFVI
jgi:DNA-3-methyladenine glycosylase